MADIDLHEMIREYNAKIQSMQNRPIRNARAIRRIKSKIAAIAEASRDVTSTNVVRANLGVSQMDRNNYPTYAKQVDQLYQMYDAKTTYGGEILASVADMRVAFIAGEGISFVTTNKAKETFIQDFLKRNRLSGSMLLSSVLMGEMEGKVLFTLTPVSKGEGKEKEVHIDARLFSWYRNKYTVKRNENDYSRIDAITYKLNESDAKETTIALDKSVYVKLGGCDYKSDDTPTRLGKILTQCENASRAMYDLRKNTHLFGKVMPYWKTADAAGASVINAAIESRSFEVGDGYAGPADMKLLEPTGESALAIKEDLLCSLRSISSMTSVPIHWMAWPELMSNRATAENFLESISAGTKRDRLIWEEGITEIIDKALQLAVDAGYDRAILDSDYTVKLPLISLAALQQLIDVWMPIYQEGLISKFTMTNMLPSIDPAKEKKLIEDEKKEAAERSPLKGIVQPSQDSLIVDQPPNSADNPQGGN